jgi:putative flippase GtrA
LLSFAFCWRTRRLLTGTGDCREYGRPLAQVIPMYAISTQFFRFLLVGVGNTLFSLSVIYLLKWFLDVNDAPANLIGYVGGVILSFTLNSRWTFRFRGDWRIAFATFLLVFGIAYLSNLTVVLGLIRYTDINSYIAHALGMPVYTILGFLGSRYLVFRPQRTKAMVESER